MRTEALRVPLLRRPRLRWLLIAALLVALAVLAPAFLAATSGPAVKNVFVRLPAGSHLSVGAVRAAAAPAIHGGLLAVNIASVQRHVEALAWVKRAEVRRVWPDALAIAVTPERAMALWGKDALMDASGQVFAPAMTSRLAAEFAGLPRLAGAKANAAALWEEFVRVRASLAPLGVQVSGLAEDPRGEVVVTLADGGRVELGREDPRAKLARFVTVAAPALGTALARAATVDMRYPNGFAVGWKRKGKHG